MKPTPLIFFLWLIISISAFAQSTIESIPNQKLINNSYVSNPDEILDGSTITEIDSVLSSLEKATSVQIAVVAVNSIGDDDVFEFAQKLFNTWGIGQASNNNGLLILLVKDAHIVRFHTGYGLEGSLPDATCKKIQQQFMVPEFKNGNYNAGILAGVKETDKVLRNPNYASELKGSPEEMNELTAFVLMLSIAMGLIIVPAFFIKNSGGHFYNSKNFKQTLYREMRLPRWLWVIEFMAIPALIIGLLALNDTKETVPFIILSLYFYFMLTLVHRLIRVRRVVNRLKRKEQYYEVTEFLRKGIPYWFFMAIFFPFPFLIYFIYHLVRRGTYRNHARTCVKCRNKMTKLAETNEDQFLTSSQQMEETLKSVDYDVWKCDSCANIQRWVYPNRRSKYKECPKCKTLAYYFVSSRTIESASYTSSGEGEQIHECKFCNFKKRERYTIAQLVHSDSSDSSSSSSSSSSSGGSWGGGSSGGGGASSSW